jgi:PAS domain S-box-containing protein
MHDPHEQAGKADPVCDIHERRGAVSALQKSEERYQRITKAITDYIYTVHVTEGFATETIHGPGCIAITGYDANEFANNPFLWFQMVATDDRPRVEEQARRILAGEDPPPIEHRIIHKNRTVRWVRNTFVPHRDEQGVLVSYDGLIQDITERKQAEAAMLGSEAKFRSFVENAPDGIFLTDRNQNYRLVNPAACAMTGYTAEEFAHMNIRDLVIAESVVEASAAHDRLAAEGQVSLEVRLRRKDGSIIWVALEAVKIDEDQLLAFCKDISERKKAEEALRESEAQNRALISAIPDLIFMYSREGEYLAINANDPSLLIMPRENLLNHNIRDVLPGPVAEQFHTAIEKALDLGVVQELEYSLLIAKEEKFFEARLVPSINDKVVAIVRDITASKQALEHQRLLEAQLQQSQKMESLGTLVAGVAHNINNVLGVIMGTASLREDSAAEPSDREAYQVIGKVCNRGREVVKSLIHFAQPTIFAQTPIELNALVQEVCALLESTARNRIRIVETLTEEPLWINGSSGDISHILVNLGVNSLDAMPNGGILTFRTSVLEGDQVEISVEDNGAGMTPEIFAHVMEPFYTTKGVGQGLGLGLSMTYGVVKAHGGTIDIASQQSMGTTVKLRFPGIPAPVQIEVSAHEPVLTNKPRKVLLVDDEEDVRFLMTRMLKKAGAGEVETAASGEEALEKLLPGELPDVLILDQNMPGMTGVQLMERVRGLYPNLPILFSSGQPDIESWAFLKQPNVAVISKPFTMREIQAKLAEFA